MSVINIKERSNCVHSALLRATALATLVAASGCIPITLKTERVEPTVSATDVGPDWNPEIGPDAHLKFVSDMRHAILEKRKSVEFVEPDMVWRELFERNRPGSVQPARDLLDGLSDGGAGRLQLQCLIVLGPRVFEQYDSDKQLSFPFYSAGPQKTSLQAVLVKWGAADDTPRHLESLAQGIEREGWFPGTPLMFTRLYKKVDTDEAAFRGLVGALIEALPADRGDGPLRLAILAEAEERVQKVGK
jgi:hypothetical protein